MCHEFAYVVARLNHECAYVDLDASAVATAPNPQVQRILGEVKSLSEVKVQQILDYGEVACEASALFAIKAGLRKHKIRHQRVATVLARTAPLEEWKTRVEHARTAQRLRVRRQRAQAFGPLNERLLEECEQFLEGLRRAAAALYVYPMDDAVTVYAVASDPKSVQRLKHYLSVERHQAAIEHRNSRLVFLSGTCLVFTSATCIEDDDRVLFQVNVTFNAKRLYGLMAPHIHFGFEELLSRLRAFPTVPKDVRSELEQASRRFCQQLCESA